MYINSTFQIIEMNSYEFCHWNLTFPILNQNNPHPRAALFESKLFEIAHKMYKPIKLQLFNIKLIFRSNQYKSVRSDSNVWMKY